MYFDGDTINVSKSFRLKTVDFFYNIVIVFPLSTGLLEGMRAFNGYHSAMVIRHDVVKKNG